MYVHCPVSPGHPTNITAGHEEQEREVTETERVVGRGQCRGIQVSPRRRGIGSSAALNVSRFVDEDALGPDGLSCFFHEVQQQSLTLFGLCGPADSESERCDTRLIKC